MVKVITFEEWREKGKKLFGPNIMGWSFQCPACGHVQSPHGIKAFVPDADDNDLLRITGIRCLKCGADTRSDDYVKYEYILSNTIPTLRVFGFYVHEFDVDDL